MILAWLRLQGRRLRWLARDLLYCATGVPAFLRGVAASDETAGIAVLEGAPLAVCGAENVYRIRVVNDSGACRDLELRVRGGTSAGATFELAGIRTAPAYTASDIYLCTDWRVRFAFVGRRPAIDTLGLLQPAPQIGCCNVKATLSHAGGCLEELSISQPMTS